MHAVQLHTFVPAPHIELFWQPHCSNARAPTCVTVCGMSIVFRPTQPKKPSWPILVKPSGSVRFARRTHCANASCPIAVTFSGTATVVSPLQSMKASSPIRAKPAGRSIELRLLPTPAHILIYPLHVPVHVCM